MSVVVVNGWTLYVHPLLVDQVLKLIETVEGRKKKDPSGYKAHGSTKLLGQLNKLLFDDIPADPANTKWRQGKTLGQYTHWRRGKFGAGRFRLFFRYSSEHKIIVFAWINDENTLRTKGSRSDAYAVFRGMLDDGNPPDNWDALLKAAKNPTFDAVVQVLLGEQ